MLVTRKYDDSLCFYYGVSAVSFNQAFLFSDAVERYTLKEAAKQQ